MKDEHRQIDYAIALFCLLESIIVQFVSYFTIVPLAQDIYSLNSPIAIIGAIALFYLRFFSPSQKWLASIAVSCLVIASLLSIHNTLLVPDNMRVFISLVYLGLAIYTVYYYLS